MPRSLRQHFEADGSSTWVILRHGLKAWPVEIVDHGFRNGWDVFRQAHGLQENHKIVFGCERKWVFHTIMFDADGREIVFDWSGLNGRWQDLPPLTGYSNSVYNLMYSSMAYCSLLRFLVPILTFSLLFVFCFIFIF